VEACCCSRFRNAGSPKPKHASQGDEVAREHAALLLELRAAVDLARLLDELGRAEERKALVEAFTAASTKDSTASSQGCARHFDAVGSAT